MTTSQDFAVLNITAVEQTRQVFRIETGQHPVVYFAKTGKWQHRGKTGKGTLPELREWMKRNHLL